MITTTTRKGSYLAMIPAMTADLTELQVAHHVRKYVDRYYGTGARILEIHVKPYMIEAKVERDDLVITGTWKDFEGL